MTSIDLKDAFFSEAIREEHQKYSKILFTQLYQFSYMPNCYSAVMKIFTKFTLPFTFSKVPFLHFRSEGNKAIFYGNDFYVPGNTFDLCLQNIKDTIEILKELDFTMHPHKSIIIPNQKNYNLRTSLCHPQI